MLSRAEKEESLNDRSRQAEMIWQHGLTGYDSSLGCLTLAFRSYRTTQRSQRVLSLTKQTTFSPHVP